MEKIKDKSNHLFFLHKVIENLKDSLLYDYLGLKIVETEKNPSRCYEEFSEIVPVQNALTYINTLRALSGMQKENVFQIFLTSKLLQKKAPKLLALGEYETVFPLNKKAIKGSFEIEKKIFDGKIKGLPKVKGSLFHIYESPEDFIVSGSYSVHGGDFRVTRLPYAPYAYKKRILPHVEAIQNVGKSKYQRIHAFLDQLELCGEKIEVLMARPQVVNDIALYLSQREGRHVPLKEICPNLKVFVHYDERLAPYRKGLESFFLGLKISYVKMIWHPSGMLALQTDTHKKGALELLTNMGTFYEFIPEKDLRPDGSLMRYYRRFYQKDLVENDSYLLVVSNASGLLCYNTGLVFTVLSKGPLMVCFKRSSETLNAFGENISLDVLEDIIYTANENIAAHGFNIREYMLGDDVDAEESYWVFELSTTIDKIPEQYLQSVANQLHNEMSLKNKAYKNAIQKGGMSLPKIVFLSLGSISEVDLKSVLVHMDMSEDAERIKRLLKFAPMQKTFTPVSI